MKRQWAVRTELDMCAENEKIFIVKASIEKNAVKIAETQAKKDGAFHVKVLSCVPI